MSQMRLIFNCLKILKGKSLMDSSDDKSPPNNAKSLNNCHMQTKCYFLWRKFACFIWPLWSL